MHADFICYVVEDYKNKHNLDGRTVMSIFTKFDILNYLEKCYGALHTISPEEINWNIDEYMRQRV